MRFDRQKAFPYPVLRPSSDDYVDCEFQTTSVFTINEGSTEVEVDISYAISSEEISNEIKNGRAEYVAIISCRDTYFRQVLTTNKKTQKASFKTGLLRGEVKIEPYVAVTKAIPAFVSSDINHEFGPGPFSFSVGDILAQDEVQVFYVDRDLFKPVTSVFDLVKNESIYGAEWKISYDQDHIQIEVSPEMKEKIDNARNDKKNKVILLNSIYFAAVMQAIQKLKDTGDYDALKWAIVIRNKAHNIGCDIDAHEPYLTAERLMQYPLSLLDTYVFKGSE